MFTVLFLLAVLTEFSQNGRRAESYFDPTRIEEANYNLVMYQNGGNTLSNLTIINRAITRENYGSNAAIKIVETNNTTSPKTKTLIYVDAKTLRPLYFESGSDEVITQKAFFEGNTIRSVDAVSGREMAETVDSEIYLSNSFSELIQAHDFGRTPVLRFETFSPGKSANRFVAERVGEQKFLLLQGKAFNCWIVKFTRTDTKGETSIAGYRYVDKSSGKVLMFKSDLVANNYFTYQILFLN
jgi:hypothetical protein